MACLASDVDAAFDSLGKNRYIAEYIGQMLESIFGNSYSVVLYDGYACRTDLSQLDIHGQVRCHVSVPCHNPIRLPSPRRLRSGKYTLLEAVIELIQTLSEAATTFSIMALKFLKVVRLGLALLRWNSCCSLSLLK